MKAGTPSEHELQDLAVEISRRPWRNLKLILGIRDEPFENIDMDREGETEKRYRMLLRWKQQQGPAATYKVLHDALKRIGYLKLADKICTDRVSYNIVVLL